MASVNQTRPNCVNQMGKTHPKPLAARHGSGTAWARHAMCEWALRVLATHSIRQFPLRFPTVRPVCHHISTGLFLGRLLFVEAVGHSPTRAAAAIGMHSFYTTSMPTPCVMNRSSSSSNGYVEPS